MNFYMKLEFVHVSNFDIFDSQTLKMNKYSPYNSITLNYFDMSNAFFSTNIEVGTCQTV